MSLFDDNRPRRVLLIDDDELVIGSLRSFLVAQGSHVETATDPRTIEGEFDVVIVDPYLTGARHDGTPSLIATARARQPQAAMLVLTAYPSSEITQIAADHHALAVLAKPQSIIDIADLVNASCAGAVRSSSPSTAISSKGPL
jgi:DNA-binding NarL/FixJ family response regulator